MKVYAMVLCLGLGLMAAEAAVGAEGHRSTYTDGVYGFSISPPTFAQPEEGQSVIPVMFSGALMGGFSPNVNVTVQLVETTLAKYREMALSSLKSMGFKVTSERLTKASGKPGLLFDYEGTVGQNQIHFTSLAVVDKGRVFVVLCSARKEHFASLQKDFERTIKSFRF